MEINNDLFKTLKSFTEQALRDEIKKHGKIIQASKGDILIRLKKNHYGKSNSLPRCRI